MPAELLVAVVVLVAVVAAVLWYVDRLDLLWAPLALLGAAIVAALASPWRRPAEPLRRPGDPERDEVRRAGEAHEAAVDPLRRRDGESADEYVERMVGRIERRPPR
jgi:hypothetical protein